MGDGCVSLAASFSYVAVQIPRLLLVWIGFMARYVENTYVHVERGSFKDYLELLINLFHAGKGTTVVWAVWHAVSRHFVPIQGLFSWKLHQTGFGDILCSPRMKRCIPLALGVLSYLSPPSRWRSAISNSNFPLEVVERGNLKRLGTVWIPCPNSLLFLKNTEVRVSTKSSCSVEMLVWIMSR